MAELSPLLNNESPVRAAVPGRPISRIRSRFLLVLPNSAGSACFLLLATSEGLPSGLAWDWPFTGSVGRLRGEISTCILYENLPPAILHGSEISPIVT
jgi:hypothetical protein